MANRREIVLDSIKDGDVVYVTACSQCASKAKITVTGLEQDIVLEKNHERTAPEELTCQCKFSKYISKNEGQEDNKKVKLIIDIFNEDNQMRVIKSASIMSDKEGHEKGINFAFHIDDQAEGDSDFNDYCINISTFHTQG